MKHPTFLLRRACAIAACLTLAAVALTGCHGNKDRELNTAVPETDTNGPEHGLDGEALPAVDLDRTELTPIDGLQPVYFAYDSAVLDVEALSDVRAAYELLKEDSAALVQVAGHCDERGTQEYNLALGERRAQSVRNRLRELGISGNRIITISYGEERPVDPRGSEAAWSKNRRCEFSHAK